MGDDLFQNVETKHKDIGDYVLLINIIRLILVHLLNSYQLSHKLNFLDNFKGIPLDNNFPLLELKCICHPRF